MSEIQKKVIIQLLLYMYVSLATDSRKERYCIISYEDRLHILVFMYMSSSYNKFSALTPRNWVNMIMIKA